VIFSLPGYHDCCENTNKNITVDCLKKESLPNLAAMTIMIKDVSISFISIWGK